MRYICLIFLGTLTFSGYHAAGKHLPSNSYGLISETNDPPIEIQLGAFHVENNAVALKDKVSAIIDKPVVIDVEDGYYKVRLTGIENPEELDKMITSLGLLGIRNFWVLPFRKKKEGILTLVSHADTVFKSIKDSELIPSDTTKASPIYKNSVIALQVGVFREEAKAISVQRKIKDKLGLEADVVKEFNYFKVIVTGFKTVEEAYKYYPVLGDLGYPDILFMEEYRKIE